jgi:hypothetical protein
MYATAAASKIAVIAAPLAPSQHNFRSTPMTTFDLDSQLLIVFVRRYATNTTAGGDRAPDRTPVYQPVQPDSNLSYMVLS